MSRNLDKLRGLLAELFQLNQADLDFGIYRIMNQKRDEITAFLDNDLLPQVRTELSNVQDSGTAEAKAEHDKLVQQLGDAGVDPDTSPKVRELRERYRTGGDIDVLENEVLSHLYDFFRRYYSEGDFISQRRYKEGVYAIPYEGEEVKVYWANHDQYYVKSTESFRDYAFKLPSGKRVHFKIVEASMEKDNRKAAPGSERRFLLHEELPIEEVSGELVIRFEFRPDPDKRKAAAINVATAGRIVQELTEGKCDSAWRDGLAVKMPTEKAPDRTLLDKQLADYTARNTFDYFIHKHLERFLRQELDFYIKNEIMHLDDIEGESAARVEQYLSKVRAVRRIAHKIIDFLAQIEEFQKKLWLKKKFVVETNYCITLDRIPEEFYPEIAANDAQRQQWVELFAIDEIAATASDDLLEEAKPGYSTPLTPEFLKANDKLQVDTALFDPSLRARLCAAIDGLDAQCDGLLVHSDNFQALSLLSARLYRSVKCIYIDPPYNTGSSAIPYKNDYRHSSWNTMMRDRLALMRECLPEDGAIFVSIDKTERTLLEAGMDAVFGPDNRIEELIWAMNTNNSQAPNYSTNHEYVLVYARNRRAAEQDSGMFREPKPGFDAVMELIAELNKEYAPVLKIEHELRSLYENHRTAFREDVEARGLDWHQEKGNDPWKGLFNYCHAEYRDSAGNYVAEGEACDRNAQIWVWRESDSSMPATKQSASTRDKDHPNWRFYKPPHPTTGKPCPHPKSGWKFAYDDDEDSPDRRSFLSLDRDHRIAWGEDENKIPQMKRMLHEVETNVGKSVFVDYSDGEKQTSAMFGKSGLFLAPKHADFVSRFIVHAAHPDSIVLDCFGGSGSTAHSVIKLNRLDGGARKYVLAEMAQYFDAVLKPRILKAAYAPLWRTGKPTRRDAGVSHCLKYLRLESYEDTLNNLGLARTDQQQELLSRSDTFREDYMLRYMLDVESRGSPSLLNIQQFDDPFSYQLNVATGNVGETQPVNVDLVETFNYLIGLTVRHVDTIRGVKVVDGRNPNNERVLVLWRKVKELDSDALDEWFKKQGYNTQDMEYDIVYVNGDNNLENLRRPDQTWKVRLIEEDFHRLMFDVQDV